MASDFSFVPTDVADTNEKSDENGAVSISKSKIMNLKVNKYIGGK